MSELKYKEGDKELLLKDLCARFSYGTKYAVDGFNPEKFKNGKLDDNVWDVMSLNIDTESYYYELCHVKHTCPNETIYHNYVHFSRFKPYLFPLSSMTEEQNAELMELMYKVDTPFGAIFSENIDYFDWLNKHHFDYRGLIEKGLAIDATGLNIY